MGKLQKKKSFCELTKDCEQLQFDAFTGERISAETHFKSGRVNAP
jgi:hypothetical protein